MQRRLTVGGVTEEARMKGSRPDVGRWATEIIGDSLRPSEQAVFPLEGFL